MYWATLCKHAESYPEPVAIIEIAINLEPNSKQDYN